MTYEERFGKTLVPTKTFTAAPVGQQQTALVPTFQSRFEAASALTPKERMLELGRLHNEISSKGGKALGAGLQAIWKNLDELNKEVKTQQEELLKQHPELMLIVMDL